MLGEAGFAGSVPGTAPVESGTVFRAFAAALRLAVFRCASENGIAHTATSERRINALRRICALMVGLICFFMLFGFVLVQILVLPKNYILRAGRPFYSGTPKNVNTFLTIFWLITNPPSREATPKVFASRRRDRCTPAFAKPPSSGSRRTTARHGLRRGRRIDTNG